MLENFVTWSGNLTQFLFSMKFKKGSQTDILQNFDLLQKYEKKMEAFGFQIHYEHISPNINNVRWTAVPASGKLSSAFNKDQRFISFFKNIRETSIHADVHVNFQAANHEREDQTNLTCSPIEFFCKELEDNGRNYFSYYGFGGSSSTVINLIRTAIHRASRKSERKNYYEEAPSEMFLLRKLVFELTIGLIYFPSISLEDGDPYSKRFKIVRLPENYRYSFLPDLITFSGEANFYRQHSNPILTHIFADQGQKKLSHVTDPELQKSILQEFKIEAEKLEIEARKRDEEIGDLLDINKSELFNKSDTSE